MKTLFFAGVALFGLATTMAHAESEGGLVADTQFTAMRGILAEAPAQVAPVAMAQNGQAVKAYVTQSSLGVWLSQPQDGGGANN